MVKSHFIDTIFTIGIHKKGVHGAEKVQVSPDTDRDQDNTTMMGKDEMPVKKF